MGGSRQDQKEKRTLFKKKIQLTGAKSAVK